MPASVASWSTSSQPSSTIGAMTMASTPWLMKLRTAAICAAGSLSAALKTRSKPFSSENAAFIDSVLAERQPDSEPVCAKPTVIEFVAARRLRPAGVRTVAGASGGRQGQSAQNREAGEKLLLLHVPKPPRLGPASMPDVGDEPTSHEAACSEC